MNENSCATFGCNPLTNQCSCAPGFEAGNFECTPCSNTTFNQYWSSQAVFGLGCQSCQPNSNSNFNNNVASTCWCEPGTYTDIGAPTFGCTPCPNGTYLTDADRFDVNGEPRNCSICNGQTNRESGATQCSDITSPSPTELPTSLPTRSPTTTPTPSGDPYPMPTVSPTVSPSTTPTQTPSTTRTQTPSDTPTQTSSTSNTPTQTPSDTPTQTPSTAPTQTLTHVPTPVETLLPSSSPSSAPTSPLPSSLQPSPQPTMETTITITSFPTPRLVAPQQTRCHADQAHGQHSVGTQRRVGCWDLVRRRVACSHCTYVFRLVLLLSKLPRSRPQSPTGKHQVPTRLNRIAA